MTTRDTVRATLAVVSATAPVGLPTLTAERVPTAGVSVHLHRAPRNAQHADRVALTPTVHAERAGTTTTPVATSPARGVANEQRPDSRGRHG
jgi:hypothetical protein